MAHVEWRTGRASCQTRRAFTKNEERFAKSEERPADAQKRIFRHPRAFLTTALLADMERAGWSGCPTVCADYEGHGFRLHGVREPRRNHRSAVRQRREQGQSSVGDIPEK